MRRHHALFIAVALAVGTFSGSGFQAYAQPKLPLQPQTASTPVAYRIDPTHAQVRMTWNHLGLSNPGATFEQVEGVLMIDEANPSRSTVEVRIPVSSLDSGVAQMDAEFQTEKFFDAARYPNITFRSRSVEFIGLGRSFKVTGDLTVRNVTRQVVLDAKLNGAGEHPMLKTPAAGFSATTRLKRSDFGLTIALPMVSDEIDVQITIEAMVPQAGSQ